VDEDRRRGGVIARALGGLAAVVVYLLVAPFECTDDGTCEGLVAFRYPPDSAGHWQAIGAAALVGGLVALLLWLVLGPEGRGHTVAKIVATPLLLAGIGISVLSQSALLVVGPVVGGLVLWLMWRPARKRSDRAFSSSHT
jgi:glycerol uptake facilitator-like aquaporin